MDINEFALISRYSEVLNHLDDIVLKILVAEGVRHSVEHPLCNSSFTTETSDCPPSCLGTTVPGTSGRHQDATPDVRYANKSQTHGSDSITTGYLHSCSAVASSTARKGKKRALPYEKAEEWENGQNGKTTAEYTALYNCAKSQRPLDIVLDNRSTDLVKNFTRFSQSHGKVQCDSKNTKTGTTNTADRSVQSFSEHYKPTHYTSGTSEVPSKESTIHESSFKLPGFPIESTASPEPFISSKTFHQHTNTVPKEIVQKMEHIKPSHPEQKPVEISFVDESEMVYIIETLVEAQHCFAQFPSQEDQLKEFRQGQEKFLETSQGVQSKETGASTGKTKALLMEKLVEYFEQKITETVKFAKRIPGFLDLPQDDQVSLIKESRIESDLITAMTGIHPSSFVFTTHDGFHFSMEDMKTVFPQELLDMFLEGVRKVSKIKATAEEAAVIRAIAVTSSDRCQLECRGKVEEIFNRLVSCLLYIVQKRCVPLGVRLGQLVDFLLFCRNITDVGLKTMKNILIEAKKYSTNPIITEVL